MTVQDREFMKLTVRKSNGRPYYSIIYLEFDDNGIGHDLEGYSSYSLDVISDYLKKYFMPSAKPVKNEPMIDFVDTAEKAAKVEIVSKKDAQVTLDAWRMHKGDKE